MAPIAATTAHTHGRPTARGGRTDTTIRDRIPALDSPAGARAFARHADPGARAALLAALQRVSGNHAAAALFGPATSAPAVQRWAVNLAAGTTDCDVIVNYMNKSSPYAGTSGWARTKVTFSWDADPVFSGSGSSTTLTLTNAKVTVAKSVDMPAWSPTNAGVKAAWSAMTKDLRAHEARHEAIGDTWRPTLESRLSALSLSITDRSKWKAAVQAEFDTWVAQHQAAQNAIDPYSALLDCSGGDESASADVGGSPGEVVASAED